tara:strand:- start:338 stop:967 length:630 start_codon:yes stop_codon:yes gene_type:complete
MIKQNIFKFNFHTKKNSLDFYLNKTNELAYKGILDKNNKYIFLKGPKKSGKTYFANLWKKTNKAIIFDNNFNYIINNNKNILVENINNKLNQENLFHILNHCNSNNLNILITSNLDIDSINFSLQDLISRLKIFTFLEIKQPDDDMLINLLTKYFIEKQFIINSKEIFQYIIKHTDRTYENMFNLVNKLDTLSIEKKRQLTIPLIKEIL